MPREEEVAMVLVDWIFIAGLLLFALIGLGLGFGKQLSFLTKGIFGVIISVVVCYFIFGLVYQLPFVQALLNKFRESLSSSEKPVVQFLLKIRVDIIAYAVALFVVVSIARLILVAIIKNVMEADTTVMKVINKTLGLVLGVAVFAALGLIALQIVYLSGDGSVPQGITGSFFKMDYIYTHNPLTVIEKLWK